MPVHTEITSYNPDQRTYAIDPGNNMPIPGQHDFVPFPSNRRWILGTYESIRVDEPGSGFAGATNRVTLLTREGDVEAWPLQSKHDVAARLVALVAARLSTPSPTHV